MARHNNPRWNRALQQASGMKRHTSAPDLSPEVVPVVILEDLTRGIDPDTEPRACMGGATITGNNATLRGFFYVLNPVGSGLLVVLKRAWCLNTSGILQGWDINVGRPVLGNPAAGGSAFNIFLNQAIAGSPQSTCVFGQAGAGIGGQNIERFGVTAVGQSIEVFFDGVVLAEGCWAGIQHVSQLTTVDQVGMMWTEQQRVRG
jgi:hypothetical protein